MDVSELRLVQTGRAKHIIAGGGTLLINCLQNRGDHSRYHLRCASHFTTIHPALVPQACNQKATVLQRELSSLRVSAESQTHALITALNEAMGQRPKAAGWARGISPFGRQIKHTADRRDRHQIPRSARLGEHGRGWGHISECPYRAVIPAGATLIGRTRVGRFILFMRVFQDCILVSAIRSMFTIGLNLLCWHYKVFPLVLSVPVREQASGLYTM
jgi:hypothetical protein